MSLSLGCCEPVCCCLDRLSRPCYCCRLPLLSPCCHRLPMSSGLHALAVAVVTTIVGHCEPVCCCLDRLSRPCYCRRLPLSSGLHLLLLSSRLLLEMETTSVAPQDAPTRHRSTRIPQKKQTTTTTTTTTTNFRLLLNEKLVKTVVFICGRLPYKDTINLPRVTTVSKELVKGAETPPPTT